MTKFNLVNQMAGLNRKLTKCKLKVHVNELCIYMLAIDRTYYTTI